MIDSKVYELSIDRFNKKLFFWFVNYRTKWLSLPLKIIINTNSD